MQSKQTRTLSVISAVLFLVLFFVNFISMTAFVANLISLEINVHSQIAELYVRSMISEVANLFVFVAFTVLLFSKKNKAGLAVTAGLNSAFDLCRLIIFKSGAFSFVSSAFLFAIALIRYTAKDKSKSSSLKVLWFFPPIFCFISKAVNIISMFKDFSFGAEEFPLLEKAITVIPNVIVSVLHVAAIALLSCYIYLSCKEECAPPQNTFGTNYFAENAPYTPFAQPNTSGAQAPYTQPNIPNVNEFDSKTNTLPPQ